MNVEFLKNKINELMGLAPTGVTTISYSKKIINNVTTDINSITFGVMKKKPLVDLNQDEILPSDVLIDGNLVNTDVIETGIIHPLQCNATTLAYCYQWKTTSPPNRNRYRPIRGGISLTNTNIGSSVGTLGFLALDQSTNALVGVTNAHVVTNRNFYSSYMNPDWVIQNQISNNAFQNGENPLAIQLNPAFYKIGELVRYTPFHLRDGNSFTSLFGKVFMIWEVGYNPPNWAPQVNANWPLPGSFSSNTVDAAVISINPDVVDPNNYNISSSQLGLDGTEFLSFATTQEIDSLLNNIVLSSGRTTGAKSGDTSTTCGIKISGNFVTAVIYYPFQVSTSTYNNGLKEEGPNFLWYGIAQFTNTLLISRIDPNCLEPVAGGDSGSAVICEFDGVKKIIGLVFAGNSTTGYVCRIDEIADKLNIVAWTGQTPTFFSSKTYISVSGRTLNDTQVCNGAEFYNGGLVRVNYPCN